LAFCDADTPLADFLLSRGADPIDPRTGAPYKIKQRYRNPTYGNTPERAERKVQREVIGERVEGAAVVKLKPGAKEVLGREIKPTTGYFPGPVAGLVADYLTAEDLAVIERVQPDEPAPARGDTKGRAAEEPVAPVKPAASASSHDLALLQSQLLVLSV